MISDNDFAIILSRAEELVRDSALEFMTSYAAAGVDRRTKFAELALRVKQMIGGNQINPNGSFTPRGARQAYGNETAVLKTSTFFGLRLKSPRRSQHVEETRSEHGARWRAIGSHRN